MEVADKLGGGDAGSAAQWIWYARTRWWKTDSSGVEDDLAIGANSETTHWALDRAGES